MRPPQLPSFSLLSYHNTEALNMVVETLPAILYDEIFSTQLWVSSYVIGAVLFINLVSMGLSSLSFALLDLSLIVPNLV